MLLKESPDFLPRGSISTSLNTCRAEQSHCEPNQRNNSLQTHFTFSYMHEVIGKVDIFFLRLTIVL